MVSQKENKLIHIPTLLYHFISLPPISPSSWLCIHKRDVPIMQPWVNGTGLWLNPYTKEAITEAIQALYLARCVLCTKPVCVCVHESILYKLG